MTGPGTHLVVTVRLLDGLFHGLRDRGEPEYPPSPLRLFQALVAAAARCNGGTLSDADRAALEWLEDLPAPAIVAPPCVASSGYTLSVPNNAMDLVARAWSRGNESNSGDANPSTHRTMKGVRPQWLRGSESVHYLWRAAAVDAGEHGAALSRAAAGMVALGLGMDLAIGQAGFRTDWEIEGLAGERWLPGAMNETEGLRVPVSGTVQALVERHGRFLTRVTARGLVPPPLLSRFDRVDYRRATDPRALPYAVFSLLTPDLARRRPFDAVRRGLSLAGMTRHATRRAAERAGWNEDRVNAIVLGHATGASRPTTPVGPGRFAYLPLPSLENRNGRIREAAGAIRRVLVVSFDPARRPDIEWAARGLSGEDLIDEATGEVAAVLSLLPRSDIMVRRYTTWASTWASVTPVVLPGHDDPGHYRRRLRRGVSPENRRDLLGKIDRRVDSLVRKAIVHAGFAPGLADHASIDWRTAGFLPGVDRVDRYGVPDHLRRFPRLHVRIEWRDAGGRRLDVPGPICLGGGRFVGLGLLVPVS